MRTRRLLLLLAMASLVSGAAALIFQTLWMRAFAIILGSTVEAAAITFSAFLCGLALGAQAAGAVAARLSRPLSGYALVELLIGATALCTGLVLQGGSEHLSGWLSMLDAWGRLSSSFVAATVLLAIPTLLMGATFPLVLEAWKAAGGDVRDVGLVYAFNVFGAACGALLGGFLLIRAFGVTGALAAAAALNAVAALLALAVRGLVRAAAPPEPSDAAAQSTVPGAGEGTLLSVVFLSGFLVLGYEIAWARLASFFLGNRIFAAAAALACVLVLLALGSLAATWMRRAWRLAPLELFSLAFTAAAFGCLLSSFAAWFWISYQEAVEALVAPSAALQAMLRLLACFVLMLPVFLPLGVLFPLGVSLAPRLPDASGRVAGRYYLVNTAGAVLGALAVAFFAMPAIGTPRTLAVLSALCAFAAVAFHLAARRRGASPRLRLLPAVACAVALFAAFLPPRILLTPYAEPVALYREDEHGVLQVIALPNGQARVVHNRTELVFRLGHPMTAYVQQMQGHLGMFFVPEATRAVVLGSGYGITAGALTAYPQLARIDAVEIVPAMLEAADLFRRFNYSYHRDPRVRLHADDGRHFLARSRKRYDIISVNVTDPELPGSSALFHREFYELVRERLNPGGVLIQHAFGNEIGTVLATLAEAFPYLRLFPSYGNGFNVVASLEPLDVDAEQVDRITAHPRVREVLGDIGVLYPVNATRMAAAGLTPEELPALFGPRPIATDDRPRIEFSTTGSLFFSNQ